jgi:hypothetical protein
MQTFFVEIKCKLGKTYQVASELADREIAEKVQTIPEIQDTHTIITFKAF